MTGLPKNAVFRRRLTGSRADAVLAVSVQAASAVAALVVAGVFIFLVVEAWPALSRIGLGFISDDGWHPYGAERAYGLLPILLGTLLSSLGALLLAVPLGLAAAVFLRCYAPPWAAGPYRRAIEVLAGIPSVIYGFWGLVVLVPLLAAWAPPGASLLAASLILAIMILPTVALFADAALGAVPSETIAAGVALGLSRLSVVWRVLLPAARGGIATGVLLAAGRAIGETMAVLMVAGNVVQLPASMFEPVRTLTANIALEMAYALSLHRSALFASGLLLLVLTAVLVAIATRFDRDPLRA